MIQKKSSLAFVLALALSIVWGCGGECKLCDVGGTGPSPTSPTTPSPTTPTACTFAVSPASQEFSSQGGTGSVTVVTQSNCAWTATSNASWIVVNAIGTASVQYTVNPNIGAAREATLTVAGKPVTITQKVGTPATVSYNLYCTGGSCSAGSEIPKNGDGSYSITTGMRLQFVLSGHHAGREGCFFEGSVGPNPVGQIFEKGNASPLELGRVGYGFPIVSVQYVNWTLRNSCDPVRLDGNVKVNVSR